VDDSPLALVRLGLTAALDIALAFVIGALASRELIGPGRTPWASQRRKTLRRCADIGLAVLFLIGIVLVWVQAAVMAEEALPRAIGSVGTFLRQTHAGRASAAGLAVLALAVAGSRTLRHGRTAALLVAGCLGTFAASRSWSGHAGVSGEAMPFAIDWMHVLGTSVWAGAVWAAAFVVLRPRAPSAKEERTDCAAYVRALSTTATWAVVVVLVTGALGAWRVLGASPNVPLGSSWGVVLVVKLALVAVAIALGAHNRFAILPRLDAELGSERSSADRSLKTFAAVMVVEALVLLAVEVAAAALSTTSPPAAA
jgi:putative copper resistance protein D